jgi:hypothetical protein
VLSIVRRNFPLKAFAFGLALAAWAYFHFSANPNITARFDQQLRVPLVVTGLRPGYAARYSDKFAVVTIDATHNETPVKADDVQAVLNLATYADPGVFNVPVQVNAANLPIRSLTPASVRLTIDRLEGRDLPVSITYNGDFKNTVVDSAAVSPALVTVRGVAADLARVTAVRVEITLPVRETTIDAMIRPLAVTGSGDKVSAVTVSPNLVRVRARFLRTSPTGTN